MASTTGSSSDRVAEWLRHIHALAQDIGPRGSTTEGERRGTQYCAEILTRLGFAPRIDAFPSARSIHQPHLIASALMLAAFVLYPLGGRATAILAAVLSILALLSDLMELSFRDNLLRRIVPKGMSQNAVAEQRPRAEQRADVVLIGHVDSHRTPIIFSTTRWLAAYRLFTTVAFILFASQVILHAVGSFTLWRWIWSATFPSAVGAVWLAAMCLQADATPFSHGANDNASGAGLVLTLAREFADQPLAHTRVWYVLTGCEEVQHYGAIDFFRRYRSQLVKPKTIAFEMLGCAGPSWLVREGILIPFHTDPGMVQMAGQIARQHPQWKAHATVVSRGNTEMADALRLGIPAITLSGWGPHGEAPYWHMVADTADKWMWKCSSAPLPSQRPTSVRSTNSPGHSPPACGAPCNRPWAGTYISLTRPSFKEKPQCLRPFGASIARAPSA